LIHGDVLGERAKLSPDRTALVVVETGERLTYRQLDGLAAGVARAFLGPLGLAAGDRVGLLSHNRPEFVAAFFGAAKSGCVLVPMGTRLTPRELLPIVENSGMTVLLYDEALSDSALPLQSPGLRLVPLAALASLVAEATSTPLPSLPSPESLFCLLYTSGTTGQPKGVMVPHRMVSWNAYNTVVAWQLGEKDVTPIYTPLYHAGGLGAFLAPMLLAGGTVVLHKSFDADVVWRTMEAEGVTVSLGVPTIWKLLLESPEIDRVNLSKLRWLISGGAPLPRSILDAYQARGIVLKQGYGMTEVGVNCFAMSEADALRKAGSIGRPLPFTEARLLDGELLLRGPHVCQGYWRNPDATRDALDPGGFFHTGDLATIDADGFYTIVGRKKDMFISGGVNVYPAEIEAALLDHPSVREAAVTGVPHPTWGEIGVAFVVPRAPAEVDAAALAAFLETRLAKFKIPRDFVSMDALPVTPYGKVVKGELRLRYIAKPEAR